MILGLDLASKTGWCFIDKRGNIIASGVQDFTKKRGESNGLMFLRFRKWLQELIKLSSEPVKLIGYEQAHFAGGGPTEICVGLQTHAQSMAAELEIESAPVHTGTLKKFATGSGRASKDDMIAAASLILKRRPLDDNEADAVHLSLYLYNFYGGI